jgi:hypothetical protein
MMPDLFLKFIPDADSSAQVYSFSDNLREQGGGLTAATVLDSRFVISSLAGSVLGSWGLGAIQWDDANKLLSIQIKNGELAFATRDMEVSYSWWVELSDGRAVQVAEGRAHIERGAA